MPDNESMSDLARSLDASLRRVFDGEQRALIFRELQEGDHAWMRASFVLYDYWEIQFVYDRGAFGFSIPFRHSAAAILGGPTDAFTLDDLDALLYELGNRARLRIPDKYLAARGVDG